MLDVLVRMADGEHALESEITLVFGGSVVSGTLVGPRRWLASLTEQVSTSPSSSGTKSFIQEFTDANLKFRDEQDNQNPDAPAHYAYIHLRDASIWQGAQRLSSDIHWRGRITEVDGWNFGSLR
ncbi:MAG: hypothetical protein ACRDYU_03715 [Actinomycetes bacterium]